MSFEFYVRIHGIRCDIDWVVPKVWLSQISDWLKIKKKINIKIKNIKKYLEVSQTLPLHPVVLDILRPSLTFHGDQDSILTNFDFCH